MKKRIILIAIVFLLIQAMNRGIIVSETVVVKAGDEAGQVYSGELVVPQTSYNLTLGAYILDGMDVWTMEEEKVVMDRKGLICTWVHDGTSEGLADYTSGKYPYYKHYCENETVFAPCFVLRCGQSETMYTTYAEFEQALNNATASANVAANVETYKAFYARSIGTTNYVVKNGNLSLVIPVTVSAASGEEGEKAAQNQVITTPQNVAAAPMESIHQNTPDNSNSSTKGEPGGNTGKNSLTNPTLADLEETVCPDPKNKIENTLTDHSVSYTKENMSDYADSSSEESESHKTDSSILLLVLAVVLATVVLGGLACKFKLFDKFKK